ncbi:hexokinase [Ranunculus cassubicifolius]
MPKVPDHQVAGHEARDGMLGPLIDDFGRFCKPLQNDERGNREVAFYTSLSSNTSIPDHIRRYFPVFHGTQQLEASDGSGLHPHLILQDIMSTRIRPSVIDIKIGSRTWYPQASEEYIQKCLKKDRNSTSLRLGLRISGLKTYGNEESIFWKPDKKHVQRFNTEDVWLSLKRFISSNPLSDTEPDCCFASTVYGGPNGILAQLVELKEWFEVQTIFQFNSCSVLIVYEKDVSTGGISRPEVKLIDFAHVVEDQGIIDHNFLGGLCSLIKFVAEILGKSSSESGFKG